MSGMEPAIGGPTVPARLSSRSVTLACAILFALLLAAWVPLWLLARQSPLVNGGEVLGAAPLAVVGLVIARRQPGIAERTVAAFAARLKDAVKPRLGLRRPGRGRATGPGARPPVGVAEPAARPGDHAGPGPGADRGSVRPWDLCPWIAEHLVRLTAEVFVGAEAVLDVGFDDARAGLVRAVSGEWLAAASADAYGEWNNYLARVGPRGAGWGMSWLVEVRFRELVTKGNSAVLIVRWEAVGSGGGWFPVLDADITLTPYGSAASLLALSGAYRPPLGALGAALDRVLLHRVAEATIQGFVNQLGEAVVQLANEPKARPESRSHRPPRSTTG